MEIRDITLSNENRDKFNFSTSGNVVIPGFVTDPDTGELCRITTLASDLFRDVDSPDIYNVSPLCYGITSIVVPPTVTVIQNGCFTGLLDLSKVILPDGIEVLSFGIFSDCASLVDITLPASLEEIEGSAFQECPSLKELKLPNSVKRIGRRAFYNCRKLENIKVPATVENVDQIAFGHVPHIYYYGNLFEAPWGAQYMNGIKYCYPSDSSCDDLPVPDYSKHYNFT